jgi:tRNA (guanine-N7-)-methyltransferase
VLNEQFVGHIERTLVPGGSLHYWTDVRERFEETLALLATKAMLKGPLEVEERAAEHDLDYRTHFERRMRLAELPVYRAEFCRR